MDAETFRRLETLRGVVAGNEQAGKDMEAALMLLIGLIAHRDEDLRLYLAEAIRVILNADSASTGISAGQKTLLLSLRHALLAPPSPELSALLQRPAVRPVP